MSKILKKRFDAADETRSIPKGKIDVVKIDDHEVLRVTYEPGWRWSESIGPMVKTESCRLHHLIYFISGRFAVRMDDGTTLEFGPGDVGHIPPGHDGWTVGNEPCVGVDFGGVSIHSKR